MAKLLDGKSVALDLDDKLAVQTEQLKAAGIVPTLAILRVGERDDDMSYERGATKRAQKIGIEVRRVCLPKNCSQERLESEFAKINDDSSVHGILMFRPLPFDLCEKAIIKAMDPHKDIDGITPSSMAGVFSNSGEGFAPCTAEACIDILDYYNIDPRGKNVVVLGRSMVVGRPVAMMLINRHATVTICHTKTVDVQSITCKADIVIVAVGKMETIGPDYFCEGQTVIDVGIGWNEEKQKLCGDVLFEEVEPLVAQITPVPGGVGSVTTSVLMGHVVKSAKKLRTS